MQFRAAFLIPVVLVGCGQPPATELAQPEPEIKQATEVKEKLLPEIVGLPEKDDPGISDTVQVGKEVEERKIYRIDTRLKTGSLRCKAVIRAKAPLKMPEAKHIDLTGKWAIRNPIKYPEPVTFSVAAIPKRVFRKIEGEEEYYRLYTGEPSPWLHVGAYDKDNKWHHVEDAVIILRDLWMGTKPGLERGSLSSQTNGGGNRTGIVTLASYHGRGSSRNILLTQVNQKAVVYNCDYFPEEFIFSGPDGREIERVKVDQYQPHQQNPAHLNVMAHVAQHMRHGPYVTSPVFKEPGIYTITSARCPWKICYVLVLSNPYAEMSLTGRFQIDNIPVGKYRMEVWHQSLKPRQQFYDVEIKEPEDMVKVLLEFETP